MNNASTIFGSPEVFIKKEFTLEKSLQHRFHFIIIFPENISHFLNSFLIGIIIDKPLINFPGKESCCLFLFKYYIDNIIPKPVSRLSHECFGTKIMSVLNKKSFQTIRSIACVCPRCFNYILLGIVAHSNGKQLKQFPGKVLIDPCQRTWIFSDLKRNMMHIVRIVCQTLCPNIIHC